MAQQQTRVFITGGASGLGLAIAQVCLQQGWKVCVGDLAATPTQELKTAPPEQFIYQRCDVTQEADLQAAADHLQQQWGGIDVLINNAGVAQVGAIDDVSMQDWRWIMDINLLGVVAGCKAFTPLLKAQGQGHIVNIASMAGLLDVANMSSYNVSKAAVVSLSETLQNELLPFGIHTTVVCPSFFRTNLGDSMRSTVPGMDKTLDKLMNKSELSADDIAQRIILAIERQTFYLLPHKQGRRLWLLKRFLPRNWYLRLMQRGGKPGGKKR
ncbi:short chain dehydrogenase [Aliidiomarina minuta]|uniref:Short chain dehydrogenase n=2 Tax=Aliidiomarina minuta TaxID=880057 RepID=A0A432WAS3_9GAMM|nr:short chain dehydrogenase [Aliidiomarina minuta]